MSSFYGGVAINSGSGGGSGVGIANIEINNERHIGNQYYCHKEAC